MEIKFFDAELNVMEILWEKGDTTAKEISDMCNEKTGWNINTTYTVINKCIAKGAIQRIEPKFMCHALIGKEEVQEHETNELANKLFDGSVDLLLASLLSRKKLSKDKIKKLYDIVNEKEMKKK